jgi:hypothetical protein
MSRLRSLLAQSPAIAVSAAALVLAAGTGVSFAASSPASAPTPAATAVTTLTWHKLPLGKGWTGSLKYAVSNGVVYLAGSAGNSTGTSVMTTLPVGARPTSSQQDLPIAVSDASAGTIQLLSDGTIFPFDAAGNYSFVSLSGVSFGLGS